MRGLNDEQLTRPIAGTWSAREILVHMGAWYDMIGQALERMGRGERPAPEGVNLSDTDGMNARYVGLKFEKLRQLQNDVLAAH